MCSVVRPPWRAASGEIMSGRVSVCTDLPCYQHDTRPLSPPPPPSLTLQLPCSCQALLRPLPLLCPQGSRGQPQLGAEGAGPGPGPGDTQVIIGQYSQSYLLKIFHSFELKIFLYFILKHSLSVDSTVRTSISWWRMQCSCSTCSTSSGGRTPRASTCWGIGLEPSAGGGQTMSPPGSSFVTEPRFESVLYRHILYLNVFNILWYLWQDLGISLLNVIYETQ